MEATQSEAASTTPNHPDIRSPDDFPEAGNGLYHHVPAEAYHGLDGRASSSVIREILTDTPAHAKAKMEDQTEPTSAMRLGTLLHMAILEPNRFELEYAVPTRCQGITGKGERCSYDGSYAWVLETEPAPSEPDVEATDEVIQWFCGTHEPSEGDILTDQGLKALRPADVEKVSASKMDKIEGMRAALRDHTSAEALLFDLPGWSELTVLFEHPDVGVPCKARIDRVVDHPSLGTVAVDYKTAKTADPDAHAFGRSALYGRYDVQAEFYMQALEAVGLECEYFLWVVQEKSPPYATSALMMGDDQQYQIAQKGVLEGLREYKQCVDEGEWPGYSPSVQPLRLPEWYYTDRSV